MKLSDIGEFALIDLISRREKKLPSTIIGIGDDCAVLRPKTYDLGHKTKYLLVTTDTFVENVHFIVKTPGDFYYLGRKAMAANISDIVAMGGVPTHALVTIGLPKKTSVKAVQELYRGMDSLAKKCRIDIVGGDTVASPRAVLVSITLLGEAEKPILRSTARVGDLICVTGRFGGAARDNFKLQTFMASGVEPSNVKIKLKESGKLAKAKLATSMIDSSDGLVRSVLEIAKASKVGAEIFEDLVPRAKGATLDQALYGGEEYELVFTIRANNSSKLKQLKLEATVVGTIVAQKQGVRLVDAYGKIKPLKSGGYEHYK